MAEYLRRTKPAVKVGIFGGENCSVLLQGPATELSLLFRTACLAIIASNIEGVHEVRGTGESSTRISEVDNMRDSTPRVDASSGQLPSLSVGSSSPKYDTGLLP